LLSEDFQGPFHIFSTMLTCNVCAGCSSSPVCLPCGHIFCNDCVFRTIRAIAPLTTLHHCPACQTPYSTVMLDDVTVPPHLRANLLPSVRKLQPTASATAAVKSSSSSSVELQTEVARLKAENAALQKNCGMWRKRAEAHSSSTLGLLQLVRRARDQAIEVSHQRDELRMKCEALQRRLYDQDDLEEEDLLDTGEEPFLPAAVLGQVDKFSKDGSLAMSFPENVKLKTIKRVRTPYESPSNSDAEDEGRPPAKRIRMTPVPPLSPLLDLKLLPCS